MRTWVSIALAVSLSACGGLYNSPGVVSGDTAVGEVRLVQIDAGSVLQANRSAYRPRTLPAIFSHSAGTGGGLRGTGAVPAPVYDPEPRPAAPVTRLPPPYTPGAYKIGVGDVILLATPSSADTVEALTGLLAAQSSRQGYTVQDDGAITVPDVGRIRIEGLSLEEAEAAIFQALVAEQIDPTFSLEIAEFNSQSVAIGGAVQSPMAVPITLRPVTLTRALTAAGGLAVDDKTYATIRLYRDGKIYQIPVTAFLDETAIQGLALKDGDSVFVDKTYDLARAQGYFAEQIELASFRQTARQAALAQLNSEVDLRRGELTERRENYRARVDLDAVDRDYVYIAGEVGVQNRFTLPFDRKASLADALFEDTRGVPTQTGNISEVYVLRGSGDGSGVTAWRLNALNAANLVLATRFELRPNDVVFVAEQPVTALDRLITQIAPGLRLAGL